MLSKQQIEGYKSIGQTQEFVIPLGITRDLEIFVQMCQQLEANYFQMDVGVEVKISEQPAGLKITGIGPNAWLAPFYIGLAFGAFKTNKTKTIGSTYIIYQNPTNGEEAIKCLLCEKVSYNLNDISNLYCGHCHTFHKDLKQPNN